MSGIFGEIRSACAEVARRARSVRIDDAALVALADAFAREPPAPAFPDPGRRRLATDEATLAFTLTLNAVNFGSGWFPHLRKIPGRSGYFTVGTRLRERFERSGPFAAEELARVTAADCAALFGQDPASPAGELMALFARSLNDLGREVADRHGGEFGGLVAEAGGSAARLLAVLSRMPLYRDVSTYDGFPVPFMKRGQLLAADLAALFGGAGPGRFTDLGSLTIFADNLVPHVLRMKGVLRHAEGLAARIDREEPLPAGSPEEVEIRACALYSVERLSAECGARGFACSPARLDEVLWILGQDPAIKAVPRHRARCTFY